MDRGEQEFRLLRSEVGIRGASDQRALSQIVKQMSLGSKGKIGLEQSQIRVLGDSIVLSFLSLLKEIFLVLAPCQLELEGANSDSVLNTVLLG